MATLDDKLLGEKLHYYCSSSEDEDEKESGSKNDDEPNTIQLNPNEHNTGPKGVIEDWRRYKQLEVEKREIDERERLDLAKKLSLNCRSEKEDREINSEIEKLENDLDDDDEFLQEYIKKRMHEMIESSIVNRKHFGYVFELKDGDEFLNTVDDPEHKNVLIVIHIWDRGSDACKAVNGCLLTIAKEYNYIKFCRIQVSFSNFSWIVTYFNSKFLLLGISCRTLNEIQDFGSACPIGLQVWGPNQEFCAINRLSR